MKKTNVVTLILLVLILLTVGVFTYISYKTPNDQANSKALTDLQATETAVYTDLDGNPFTFEAFEGKVRVVNAWASWTPFSQNELKNLETLALEYKDRDIVVIAINRKEPKEQAKRFLDSLQPFVAIHFAIDLTDAFYRSIEGYAMPETVFYDAKGNIVFQKHGDMNLEEMKQHVEAALEAQ